MIRLQKFLADAGIDSRRKCEAYIEEGRVMVNGIIIDSPGTKVDPDSDIVLFDGKPVTLNRQMYYILLNKPRGFITSVTDPYERKTVLSLVNDIPARLVPVGRLDLYTTGLLLLSNDGEFVYKLTHPSHNINKEYIATVSGRPADDALQKLRDGVIIDDYQTSQAEVSLVKTENNISTIKLVIHEGRNRQIRKMFQAIGFTVRSLKRTAVAGIRLGDLKQGSYRFLTKSEVKYLMNL